MKRLMQALLFATLLALPAVVRAQSNCAQFIDFVYTNGGYTTWSTPYPPGVMFGVHLYGQDFVYVCIP